MVNVTPSVRDIELTFHDSFNCCWCWPKKEVKDDEPVFVRQDGSLERFKRVPRPSISHKLSQEHLQAHLRRNLEVATKEAEIALIRIQDLAAWDLEAEAAQRRPITLEKIKRINRALATVLQESEPSPLVKGTL